MPWASLTHFIHRASSTHFLLPYLFHSHEFLLNPLGFPTQLPHPYLSLPFSLIGLYASATNLLIHFVGFPTCLHLFYLLLFPWVYYFHSLGFLDPFASSWQLIIFVCLLTIIPSILAYWSLLYYFLSLSISYCWVFSTIGPFCQKWASTRCNIQTPQNFRE